MTQDTEDPIEAYAPTLIDLLNDAHVDSLTLIAQTLGNTPDATTARAVAVDHSSVTITTDASNDAIIVPFVSTPTSIDELLLEALAMVDRARERASELGMTVEATNAETVTAQRMAIPTWIGSVVSNEALNDEMRRIVISVPRLGEIDDIGPDQFYYLLAPPPGSTELGIDETFTWGSYEEMPEEQRPVGAYYTARFIDRENNTMTFDVLLHGETGTGSRWAASCVAESPVALWGPRTAYEPPADTECHVLVVDETALPAAALIAERLGDEHPIAIVAMAGETMRSYPLPQRDNVTVHWVDVDHDNVEVFRAALEALQWPHGTPYVWGGAESKQITAARKLVRTERDLPQERVSLVAYWKR